jgi:dihydrolipoamide dehydrogenase
MGEIVGQVKIISDSRNGKIVGVHIVGPQATDLIAEGTLAIQLGATVEDLARTIHAHPTLAEALMETAQKAMGSGLHGLKD